MLPSWWLPERAVAVAGERAVHDCWSPRSRYTPSFRYIWSAHRICGASGYGHPIARCEVSDKRCSGSTFMCLSNGGTRVHETQVEINGERAHIELPDGQHQDSERSPHRRLGPIVRHVRSIFRPRLDGFACGIHRNLGAELAGPVIRYGKTHDITAKCAPDRKFNAPSITVARRADGPHSS